MKIAIFVFLFVAGSISAKSISEVGLGGSTAYPGQYPFLAFLRLHGVVFDDYGVGSLISSRYVLTSQYGIQRTDDEIDVILGAYDWKVEEPEQIRFTVHRADVKTFYDGTSSFPGELALITLPEAVTFTERIQPVALPSWNDVENLYIGNYAITSGWTNRDLPYEQEPLSSIHYTEVRIEHQEEIGLEHWDHLLVANERIASWWEMGGPLILRSSKGITQIGVYSFWKHIDDEHGIRDFYQRIAHKEYLEWIEENTDVVITRD